MAGQVGRYGQGRTLYDDTRTVDPAARLGEAVDALSLDPQNSCTGDLGLI